MKRRLWTPLLVGAVPIAALGVHLLQGCYSVIPNDGLVDAGPPPKVDVSVPEAGKGFVGFGKVACNSAPGVLPDPNCHVPPPVAGGTFNCTPKSSSCMVGGSSCGESLCLPMAQNSTAVKNFRMEALYVGAPPTLASTFLQDGVVTSAVTLNNASMCGYGMTTGLSGGAGNGLFNWLISIDTAKKKLTTGGATFSMDPYKDGYCFANGTVTPDGGSPVTVAPLKDLPVTITGNTVTLSPLSNTLDIPIFLTSTPGSAPIILPIDGVELTATMSPDGNCIGDINPQWYANAGGGALGCQDNAPGVCPKWFTNGALAGYITLAEADKVCVAALGESLCVLLTGDSTGMACNVCGGSMPGKCCTPADLKKGDYCSTPKPKGSATGCTDSFWLAASFAANAVKINSGACPP